MGAYKKLVIGTFFLFFILAKNICDILEFLNIRVDHIKREFSECYSSYSYYSFPTELL